MEIFFAHQRWTSEGEPELGVGIIKEVTKDRVHIYFPVADETRQYAVESAPLRRVVFKQGDSIVDTNNKALIVEQVIEENNLLIYLGSGRELSEADLGNVFSTHSVSDKLFAGEVETPDLFSLRRLSLEYDHKRRISPVNGFVGGRIDLIPHQLYIAHEVSTRYAPRVLLSDQVGLGKTIEACLIIHNLLLSGRISRVLILVPDSLIHQWFVEVLRRFNMWFHIFDEERCEAIEHSAPEGNPFLDNQLIICSTDFLAQSETRARQALSADWDTLVVDEAHHLEWSEESVSPEYSIVEMLSKVAKGLLLLTATPEQLGVESHFARLRLLDPERYSSYKAFKNEPQDHKPIANLVEKLSSKKALEAADEKLLISIFGKERFDTIERGGEEVRDNLIEDLLDQHGPGRVVFRNTRSAMSGFPKRIAHLVPLNGGDKQETLIKRLSNEFAIDGTRNGDESQRFWFAEDPRLQWLDNLMEELHPQKVLLICRSKEKVLSLERAISKKTDLKVGVFHEDLTIVQRDRNAAWFSESDGARLLICSEIGSEGRNFQFAHHLILFDLPIHPELLEQRIGRLDRIGQTEDIHIHVPYVVGSPQEVLVRWFHEGLNAFEENLEGGNQLSGKFIDRVEKATLSISDKNAAKELDLLIADTVIFNKALKQTLSDGRDRLLEMNSFRPKVAAELVEQIRNQDQDLGLEIYMTRVFEHFGIEMEDLAPRTYLLHPSQTNREAFPSIPDVGIAVTFDRNRALIREDVSFISWDHPMAIGAIDMVLSLGLGATSYGILRGTKNPAILLEIIFVLETAGAQSSQIDRFLPNTPIRVVVDHTGEDVTDSFTEELLDKQLIPSKIDELISNETLVDVVLPKMIEAATELASTLAFIQTTKGLNKMTSAIDHEVERLMYLHKKNKHIRREEIQTALEEKALLGTLINDARIRLDSLQLIKKE